jgi:hypothetical protein
MENKERTGFTFYRSYYDILDKLDSDSGYKFLKALLDRQFKGIEPNLSGMADFAYVSQKHSIDKQVEGWENKTGMKLTPTQGGSVGGSQDPSQGGSLPPTEGGSIPPYHPPSNHIVMTTEGGSEGGCQDPYLQEKEKEKEKEKEQEQLKDFYKKNKIEVECIRDMYDYDLEDAISIAFQTLSVV